MSTENAVEKKTFAKGAVIFREGAWEMWMYRILSGKVGIYSAYGTEQEKLLTELAPGKLFGEMGLIEFRTRSATAAALEDTETEVIDDKTLGAYFSDDPEQALAIWRNTSARIRELSKQYTDACEAIADYLDEKSGKPAKKPGVFDFILRMIEESRKYDGIINKPADVESEIERMRGMYL